MKLQATLRYIDSHGAEAGVILTPEKLSELITAIRETAGLAAGVIIFCKQVLQTEIILPCRIPLGVCCGITNLFGFQLRDAQVERPNPLLGSPKILGIEHADLLAIRPLVLVPVVSPVIRYVNRLVR